MKEEIERVELIDKNLQELLISKYKVTFYDKLFNQKIEQIKEQKVDKDNKIIKRIDKMYKGELLKESKILYDYDPFKKYEKEEKLNNIHI